MLCRYVEKMRKTLEDFYYGNIVTCERQMAHGSELKKAADRVARYESQFTEQKNGLTDNAGRKKIAPIRNPNFLVGSVRFFAPPL